MKHATIRKETLSETVLGGLKIAHLPYEKKYDWLKENLSARSFAARRRNYLKYFAKKTITAHAMAVYNKISKMDEEEYRTLLNVVFSGARVI